MIHNMAVENYTKLENMRFQDSALKSENFCSKGGMT